MTEQEARDFCASIKFCGALSLLGPRIRVWWPEGLVISLQVPERDGKTAVQANAFEVVQYLPLEQAPKTAVLECVRAGLKMMLEHETDEGILYKGVRVYDPHGPLGLPPAEIERAERQEEEKLRAAAMPAPVFAREPYVDLHDDRFVVVGEAPGVRALRDVGYIEGLERQQITVIVDELANYAPPSQRVQEWTRAYLRDPFGILPPKK